MSHGSPVGFDMDSSAQATFARRLRVVSTVGRRQMPATRIGLRPTRIYECRLSIDIYQASRQGVRRSATDIHITIIAPWLPIFVQPRRGVFVSRRRRAFVSWRDGESTQC